MNIKNYIESGVLEEYVLGNLSVDERLKVEICAAEHSAIKTEIAAIELSFENFATAHSDSRAQHFKENIVKTIDAENGLQLMPPPVNETSKIENYTFWLNSVLEGDYEEMHMEVIYQSELETTVIAWVKNGEAIHTHTEYTERFLIAEGTCTATIGDITKDYGLGDYIEFPLHVPHSYIVTSDCPMKVVACLKY
ncbi:MAG: mannose-6-phosphate isomerase-like protein (cupin superfamily) [Crocinitomix sp.]